MCSLDPQLNREQCIMLYSCTCTCSYRGLSMCPGALSVVYMYMQTTILLQIYLHDTRCTIQTHILVHAHVQACYTTYATYIHVCLICIQLGYNDSSRHSPHVKVRCVNYQLAAQNALDLYLLWACLGFFLSLPLRKSIHDVCVCL